jgi:hypothetical protein
MPVSLCFAFKGISENLMKLLKRKVNLYDRIGIEFYV